MRQILRELPGFLCRNLTILRYWMPAFPTIDLFCGAGGLSLGAARAGLKVIAGVEWDKDALKTHSLNFPNAHHSNADIGELSGDVLLADAGVSKGDLVALIGGPPCQGFSVIGARNPADERNALFGHFMRLVAETEPWFFVAENVPGIAQSKNNAVLQKAMKKIPERYKVLEALVVEGHKYGAPTSRKRLFFIGVDPKRMLVPSKEDFLPSAGIKPTLVRDALRGLPKSVHPPENDFEEWRKAAVLPKGPFYERVTSCIPKGVGNKVALERYKNKREVNGHVGVVHSAEVVERYNALSAGEKDPVSRSVRLKSDGYCPTLRSGTGSDKGRFQAVRPIHPTEPRVITPREAARLQGFPDWFLLPNTKWHSFRQIGNSVSPLVAEAILSVLVRKLGPI